MLVTIKNVSLFLPGDPEQTTILHDISWQIQRGRHCALIGANGSGKSTLLRLVGGYLWPERGKIYWHTDEGAETSPLAGRDMCALIAPSVQEQYQRHEWDIPGLELILSGLDGGPRLYGATTRDAQRAARELAARVEATPLLSRNISSLSQGQLRLLLLCRAVMAKPALLLLDECLEGLDVRHSELFTGLLKELANDTTMIFTSHRQDGIPDWVQEHLFVHEGRLYDSPPVQEATHLASHVTRKATPHDTADGAAQPPLLELRNVSVYLERKKVLHNINWTMRQGEHWHISGENGSGKSTLLRLLAGECFVAHGGAMTRHLPGQGGAVKRLREVQKGIALVSDLGQALYDYPLTGLELVCSGFDNTIGLYRDFSKKELQHARACMELLFTPQECDYIAPHSIRMLSTGQLRRLFLARTLVGQPDILLLDEPCSGLDAQSRDHYHDLLDDLAAQGLHLVFVSHHGEDAPRCISNEAHMENGRLTTVR